MMNGYRPIRSFCPLATWIGAFLTVALAACLVLSCPDLARAARAPASQPTLNELLHIGSSQPAKAGAKRRHQAGRPSAATAKALGRSLERSMHEPVNSVFSQAVSQMSNVSTRIKRQKRINLADCREQKQIITKLDQVIAEAQRRAGGSSKSGHQKSKKQQTGQSKMNGQGHRNGPPKHGGTRAAGRTPSGAGPHGPATANEPLRDQRAHWGGLPPRLRNELADGLQERFSPLYQQMTEDYYKKLAQSSHASTGGPHD